MCGNELALSDGRVVSVEHGCGAHSEAMPELSQTELPDPVPVIFELTSTTTTSTRSSN